MGRISNLDKYTTDNTTVITLENVKYLGENIALCTLKHLLPYKYKEIADLYYGLIKDIKHMNDCNHTVSEGYDIAQAAICFLCEYIGKTLGDTVIGKYKKPVTIKHACASEIGNYIYKRRKYNENTYSIIDNTASVKVAEPFEENTTEQEYKRVNEIIKQMHLTEKQMTTLKCYLRGMGVCEISRLLSLAYSTVWSSRMILQRKYNALYL